MQSTGCLGQTNGSKLNLPTSLPSSLFLGPLEVLEIFMGWKKMVKEDQRKLKG